MSTATHATVLKVFPFLEQAPQKDRHSLREAEIQASYSQVIFTDDGVATYRGEQYRALSIGFERWRSKMQSWVFTIRDIPQVVKEAFGARELSELATP
ncbi:MAG: hypothetical protein OXG97_11240 [Candidatus Poribacteria bacterium]|nr:hypothetical protein [Candidatus Poribacteria bacterium]